VWCYIPTAINSNLTDLDSVAEADPRQVLLPVPDDSPATEVEDGQKLGDDAALLAQHHAEASLDDADALVDGLVDVVFWV
jgi:hypothetical protein